MMLWRHQLSKSLWIVVLMQPRWRLFHNNNSYSHKWALERGVYHSVLSCWSLRRSLPLWTTLALYKYVWRTGRSGVILKSMVSFSWSHLLLFLSSCQRGPCGPLPPPMLPACHLGSRFHVSGHSHVLQCRRTLPCLV